MRNDNNNDPIQEVKPFRFGIDNLLEDDTEDVIEEYNDLHDCSDDLSDSGSVKEALEHEKFANQKKAKLQFAQTLSNANPNAYKNYEKYKNYTKKDFENMKKASNVKYAVIFVIVAIFLGQIGGIVQEIISEFDDYSSQIPDYTYREEQISSKQNAFETAKQNINITPMFFQNGEMLLEIKNNNPTTYNNVDIQVIFYGENNEVITISDVYATNLFSNGTNYYEVNNLPKSYARVDFLISKRYWDDEDEINQYDVTIYMVEETNAYNIKIKNNSFEDIDSVEVLLLYFKDGEVVDFTKTTVYDIDAGEQEEKNIYKSRYVAEHDSVGYFINSISIY